MKTREIQWLAQGHKAGLVSELGMKTKTIFFKQVALC